jgi:hypothetical protein
MILFSLGDADAATRQIGRILPQSEMSSVLAVIAKETAKRSTISTERQP